MKPRARRVTLAVAVLGSGVLAVCVVAHWSALCDHFEAWHFQLTRETALMRPGPLPAGFSWTTEDGKSRALPLLLCLVANHSGMPIIFDPVGVQETEIGSADSSRALEFLKDRGFRVVEQRFPRRAYVVMRDATAEPGYALPTRADWIRWER